MRKPRISMKDIASELEISKTAVSLALGNKPGVSKELRERIFEAAARFGYKVTQKNQAPDSRKLLIITAEFNIMDRFFYSDIFLGVQKQAQVTGHFTMLTGITEAMIKKNILPDAMEEFAFDGILSVGVIPHDYLKLIIAKDIPFISVDNYYDDMPINAVVTANEEGSFEATRHLIDLGHRDIGFIAPIENSSSFFERWEGYCKALVYAKIPVQEQLSILEPWSLAFLGKDLEQIRKAIASMKRLPSAFVCGNDEMAIAVANVLRDMGKSVPEDISLTGFDDIEAARFFSPAITTYRVPRVQLGQEAVRFLLSVIADRKHEHSVIKRALYGSLQIRGSTAAPRG